MEAPKPHKDANMLLKEASEAHKNAMCLSRRHMCLTWRHLSLNRMQTIRIRDCIDYEVNQVVFLGI